MGWDENKCRHLFSVFIDKINRHDNMVQFLMLPSLMLPFYFTLSTRPHQLSYNFNISCVNKCFIIIIIPPWETPGTKSALVAWGWGILQVVLSQGWG